MKRYLMIIMLAIMVTFCISCGKGPGNTASDKEEFTDSLTETGSGLARQVGPSEEIRIYRGEEYISLKEDMADIRWYDCRNMDKKEKALLEGCVPNITFNEETVFPEEMSDTFPAKEYLEAGKKPGLGVEALHEQGITGKGVSIAVIDQVLYTGHPEYASKLALYEEMHVIPNQTGSMHAAALASLSVGDSCGVAPDAKLYFWGLDNVLSWKEDGENNLAWEEYARVIDRIIEVNKTLPENDKIRVIAIARGYDFTGDEEEDKRLQVMLDAVERAKKEGIFVLTTSTEQNYDFFSDYQTEAPFAGLGKIDPAADPDSVDNYTLGAWQWSSPDMFANSLLVPMDGRTTADMSGDTYVYYADGGWSWTVPYVAGVYALCCQVRPDMTPEEFYHAAMETSTEITRMQPGGSQSYTFHVINPQALISCLQEER